MSSEAIRKYVDALWGDTITEALSEFIRIPAKSPHFDPHWAENGHLDAAVALAEDWCHCHAPTDTRIEVVRLPGRTPLLLVDIPGQAPGGVLLYGHLDKQPEMAGWDADKGPWTPVVQDDRLYGRGSVDDGYALFSSLAAVLALRDQGLPHARCTLLIETCEESGSYDLPHYLEALGDRLGQPDLVVCLDSGCGNYEQLWCTTSLRGVAAGTLSVEVLTEGVHSGDAGGVIPSSFRVARRLLERLEDAGDGRILPAAFNAEIPATRRRQAAQAAGVLSDTTFRRFPRVPGLRPDVEDPAELILNRTWRPALEVVGASGLPEPDDAGNVLRTGTALKLSLRLPPTVDAEAATRALDELLTSDPPAGARLHFEPSQASNGWHAPDFAPWLGEALDRASRRHFNAPAVHMGEGGAIPFMGLLAETFPQAQFLVTGALGPGANAHGPNEFLHLPMARKLTACVAEVLHEHAVQGLARAD
ncbi:M20/M25/M40 family metallo-hydrolase [Alkalilimnicola ehrlichii MLHE-1]|uniref:Peptidase M20 n=1 Tax=Alkalilimnicola ehrlichii (strain ATCC BAA-1101 / DSM 17681 / MLHE-1) TaxID=187272 RepID=Q0A7V4_ALKEH|nr:M20/M25/M40 family metallo-hydrolase [Alkalilimnicola ehrlichii]ABI57083.1 peptidase M20 [Alkalilimnicola ehrlichii MLHE-1]